MLSIIPNISKLIHSNRKYPLSETGDYDYEIAKARARAKEHSHFRASHLFKVVDLPDDGFPTSPMRGSRGISNLRLRNEHRILDKYQHDCKSLRLTARNIEAQLRTVRR